MDAPIPKAPRQTKTAAFTSGGFFGEEPQILDSVQSVRFRLRAAHQKMIDVSGREKTSRESVQRDFGRRHGMLKSVIGEFLEANPDKRDIILAHKFQQRF